MNIKHPELMPLLVLIPALILLLYFVWQRRTRVLNALCDVSKLSSLFPKSSSQKTLLRYLLLVLAFTMFVTALISPRWGYDWKEIETQGTNIIIALDVSKSMLAEDISPNRLSRAKLELTKLIDKLTGDKLGLIIFAGDAFLQSPLTHDYLMVKDWISKITVDSVQTPGTSIRSALELARKAFKPVESESKALIIISDGEEHDSETLDLAKKIHGDGVNIYTIGIGTAKGSPIKQAKGLIRDSNGAVVISKLDDTFLKEIADISQGHYVRSSTGDFHLDKIYYDHLKQQLGDELLKSGKTKSWYETYQLFMTIALVALVLEILLGLDLGLYAWFQGILRSKSDNVFEVTKPQPSRKRATATLLLLIYLLSYMPASAGILDPRLWIADSKLQNAEFSEAKDDYLRLQVEDPHNPRLNYNLGVTHYRERAYDQAVNSFTQAAAEATTDILQEKALYNLGNSYFKLEDYKTAITAYESALKIDPDDEDTKHNLELARKRLQQQEQKQNDKQDDENKDDQEENQDQDKDDQDENQDDKEDQDQEDQEDEQEQEQDQQDQQAQPQPQPDELSQEDIERLLKQVDEAEPSEVKPQGRGMAPVRILNPW